MKNKISTFLSFCEIRFDLQSVKNLKQDDHKLVAESAVVGFPHPVKGEGVYAYVVVKEVAANMTPKEKEELANQLKSMVKHKISGFAVPEMIQVK